MYTDIIKEMEKYAEENSVPIMQKRSMTFLCKFIEKNNIKKILEVGTAIGYSAINMALVDETIEVVSIERDQDKYIEAIKNVKKCNLDKRVSLILGDALSVELQDKYDLIFIDAAKGQYLNFFEKYKDNLNDNGFIVSDNIDFHGFVKKYPKIENRNLRQLVGKLIKYIKFLKESEEYKTKFYKVGDGLAVTYKKGEKNE